MRTLLIIPFFLICGQLFSQIYLPVNPTIYGEKNNRQKVLLALHPPEKSDLETNTNDTTAQIFYYKTDSTFWGWSQARGFFRIGTTSTGGGMGEVDLSALYAHSTSNFDGTKVLFYNIDNVLIDSFALEYTILYVSKDFLLTDTLGLPKTKLLSLNDSAKATFGGTLQKTFDKELGQSLLDKDDTINTQTNILFVKGTGFGAVNYLFVNGDNATSYSQNSNRIILGQQNNEEINSRVASITIGLDSISLESGISGPSRLSVKLHSDSLDVSNPSQSILKVNSTDAAIYLPQIPTDDSGTPIGGLGYEADGRIVPVALGGGSNVVHNEVITGTSDPNMNIAHTPVFGTTKVYRNGVRLTFNVDYIEDGGTAIIIQFPIFTSDIFVFDYNY